MVIPKNFRRPIRLGRQNFDVSGFVLFTRIITLWGPLENSPTTIGEVQSIGDLQMKCYATAITAQIIFTRIIVFY